MYKSSYGLIIIFILFGFTEKLFSDDNNNLTLSLGVTFTDGNSKSFQTNFNLLNELKLKKSSLKFGMEWLYGENEDEQTLKTEVTSKNLKIFGDYQKEIINLMFAYFDSSYVYDEIALIDYRYITGIGSGFEVLKKEHLNLSVKCGYSHVWEKIDEMNRNFDALKLAELYNHEINEYLRIWQSLEYLPELNDFDNYLINFELGLETKLIKSLNMRVVIQDKYDNQPAIFKEKNDISFILQWSIHLK